MLAGPPTRISPAIDGSSQVEHNGYVKIRLGHSRRGTVIVPDLIFAKAGPWRFFQPSFFGPCAIAFNIEPGLHTANFSVDVGLPRATQLTRLIIRFRSDARVMAYTDGSQLYACQILGPSNLANCCSGRCERTAIGDFELQLFHHTSASAYSSIRSSQELWSSTWNLQGTRRLTNVAYVYLTCLPRIERPQDLNRIAMASDGVLRFQTTSNRLVEETLKIPVYRDNTSGRTNTVVVNVAAGFLAPPHLLFHPFVPPEPAYYEVVGPEIFRIGLTPGAKLPIPRGNACPVDHELKRFEYIVMGDASEIAGLSAPYDEEETSQVMHHEVLAGGADIFDFWLANANTDQITGRAPEARALEPPTP